MSKIVVLMVSILMLVGLFQVLAEEQPTYITVSTDQQELAVIDEASSPSPLARFERSLLAWGQVPDEAAVVIDEASSPSPLTRFERSLLAWGRVQDEAAVVIDEASSPSPLTRFEQSLLRWAQLQQDEQILY